MVFVPKHFNIKELLRTLKNKGKVIWDFTVYFCSNIRPQVYKPFSCSTQLRMKFFLLINVKMPTIVGIFTFMSGKNSILGLSEPKKSQNFLILYL